MTEFDPDIERELPPLDATQEVVADPAQTTAQAFIDQLKDFSDGLTDGSRMAVCLPAMGDQKLFVNRVVVRVPEVVCVSGVDAEGLPFSHVCHYSNFAAHIISYRVS